MTTDQWLVLAVWAVVISEFVVLVLWRRQRRKTVRGLRRYGFVEGFGMCERPDGSWVRYADVVGGAR